MSDNNPSQTYPPAPPVMTPAQSPIFPVMPMPPTFTPQPPTPLPVAPVSPPMPPVQQTQPVTVVPQTGPVAETPTFNGPNDYDKKKSLSTILIVIIGLLVAAAAGGGGYYFLFYKNDQNKAPLQGITEPEIRTKPPGGISTPSASASAKPNSDNWQTINRDLDQTVIEDFSSTLGSLDADIQKL